MDIFNELPQMTETVFILGSGVGLDKFCSNVPYTEYTNSTYITVNRSILCDINVPTIWMCHDLYLLTQEWFRSLMQCSLSQTLIFHSQLATIIENNYEYTSSGKKYPPLNTPNKVYSFRDSPGLNVGQKQTFSRGILRGGGTTSCAALQLAYHCGAKQVVLVGVQMDGRRYWDGQPTPVYPGTNWPARKYMQLAIYGLQDLGLQIFTATVSALNVPKWTFFVE